MKKKLLALLAPLALVACAGGAGPTVGVDPIDVPPLPEELDKRYEALPPITDNTLGGLVEAEVEASTSYNDAAFSYNSLVDLYKCMRPAINNRDIEALNECLGEDSGSEEPATE